MSKKRLVLIHGFLENASMWQYIVPRLSYRRNFNLSIPEIPGHGKNSFVPKEHTAEAYCENILDQLKLKKDEELFLIGHSMGGYIAANIAAMMPERVSALCLFQSKAGPDNEEKRTERRRAIEIAEKDKGLYVRMNLTNCVLEANRERLKGDLERTIADASKLSFDAIKAAMEVMMSRPDNVENLKDRKFPLYYFLSEQDPLLPYNTLQQEISELPGTVEYKATNTAHFGYMEANYEAVGFVKRIIMAV